MRNINQSGRSMLEMLGVLGIIGVLTVGGLGLISKARTNRNNSEAVDLLTTLATKARSYLRDRDAYSADTNITNAIHGDLDYNSSGYIEGPDDSRFTVTALKPEANYKYALFIITISELPEDMCMELASSNLGTITTTGFLGRSIGATSKGDWLKNPSSVPVGIGDAATVCEIKNNKLPAISFAFR